MVKRLSIFTIEQGLIPVVHFFISLYLSYLTKIRTVNEEKVVNHLNNGQKAIAALWHQRFFLVTEYAKRFSIYKPSVIISQSRDGEMITQVISSLNFRPVRGSSSRGGKEAMDAIVTDLFSHPFAVHAVDGPRGPKGIIKAGLIRIAQLSGAPIFPLYISVDRAWRLNNWDHTLIPKPFSQIFIRWGDPIYVPEDMDTALFEKIRLEVEKCMQS